MRRPIERMKSLLRQSKWMPPGMAAAGALAALLLFDLGYGYHAGALERISLGRELHRASSAMLARAHEAAGRMNGAEREVESLERGLLSSARPSIGGAELQEAFKSMASSKSVLITSEKVLETVDSGRYMRIPIEFRLTSDTRGLKDLLYDIRASRRIMGVRSMTVRAPEGGEGRLDITIVVEGAARKEAAR